jgi:von Willebrand factor type A domain-containing protein
MARRMAAVCTVALVTLTGPDAFAQLQNATPTGGANITTRKCLGGTNAGAMCNQDAACDSGNCVDYNLIDLTVNFRTAAAAAWTPNAAQMATIQGYFTPINDTLADVTDGQMALGTVTLVVANGAPNAVVQLNAGMCVTGGGPCVVNADCGAGDACNGGGGVTNTGGWGSNGKITVGVGCLQNPLCFNHEFIHLIGNSRDEYEGALDNGVDDNGNDTIDECNENQSNNRCFGGTNNGATCATNANCFGGGTCRQIVCRDGGPPALPTSIVGCLMQCCLNNTGPELCWSGNHDGDVDTEQSQCRTNNSCWTQLGVEWPSVIQVPAAGPTAGPTVSPTTVGFLTPSVLDRFVAVIDRSASMEAESPRRIDVAVTATKDFIDLLSAGTEFGLASFASADGGNPGGVDSTKDFPPEAGLRALNAAADRTAGKTAADGLASRAGGFTRIGAGLQQARSMLLEAGGAVTLNTSVLLLTDGINNRPEGSAQADLDAALAQLAADNIPVFVSCIGAARDSVQCSNIADQTAGRFVDSQTTDSLYDAFVEFAAHAERHEIGNASIGVPIGEGELSAPIPARVEAGVASARFVISWTNSGSNLDLRLFRPDGSQVPEAGKTVGSQGEFYLIPTPAEGTWTMRVFGTGVVSPERFSARSILDHAELSVAAGLARSAIQWPDAFLISANPSLGLPIEGCQASAQVVLPDGSVQSVNLHDDGAQGDKEEHDGLYQVRFRNFTAGDGIYTFTLNVRCEEGVAEIHTHEDPGIGQFPIAPPVSTFERVIRFSGTVTGVPDNLPPIADICQDVRAECQGATTPVALSGTCSSDPEGGALSYAWASATGSFGAPGAAMPTGQFPLGRNAVSLVVSDPDGASSAPDRGLVVVADTTAPAITDAVATPSLLRPPNHRMVPVTVSVEVEEACDPAPVCEVVSVESTEPANGLGDGDVGPDWEILGGLAVRLRSERSGGGDGRTYTITVLCSDLSGNSSTRAVVVAVPH